MDKLSTLLLVLLAWLGIGTANAQDGTGTTETKAASASVSKDGNVVTVTASGDLTNYKGITPVHYQAFTEAATSVIGYYVNAWDKIPTFVNAGLRYDAKSTYSTATNNWEQKFKDGVPTVDYSYINGVKFTDAVNDVIIYKCVLNTWDNNSISVNNDSKPKIASGDDVENSTITIDGTVYSCYARSLSEIKFKTYKDLSELKAAGITLLTPSELSQYTAYSVSQKGLFKSTDDGKTKTPIAPGTYTYNQGETFWVLKETSWTDIANNAEYFAEEAHTGYLKEKISDEEKTLVQMIEEAADAGDIVKFVKAEGGTDITLSQAQLTSLVQSTKLGGNSILDLSETSVTSEGMPTDGGSYVVAIVLPGNWTDETITSFVTSRTVGSNIYWYSASRTNGADKDAVEKGNLNVDPLSLSTLGAGAALVTTATKNLVIDNGKGSKGGNNHVTFSISNSSCLPLLDYAGIENLVFDKVNTVFKVSDFNGFEHVKRVIMYGKDVRDYASSTDYVGSVKVFQSLIPLFVDGKSTGLDNMQICCLKEGLMKGLPHYIDDAITKVNYTYYYGNINKDDLDFIVGTNLTKVSLASITYSGEGTDLNNIKSPHLEYLALPTKKVAGEAAGAADFPGLFTADNPKLMGVCYFDDSDDAHKGLFTARLKDEAVGNLIVLTDLDNDATGINAKITKLKLTGKYNARDLGNTIAKYLDKDGHLRLFYEPQYLKGETNLTDTLIYYTCRRPNLDEYTNYYTRCGLDGVGQLTDVDFSAVSIDPAFQDDLNYWALGINVTSLKHIDLPTDASVTDIANGALANFRSLTSIRIPHNIKYIRSCAFQNCYDLTTITAGPGKDEKDNAEGNKFNHGEKTVTLPSGLKLVETYAFANLKQYTDIYCLADIAPECQRLAFDAVSTYGRSGFTPDSVVTRKCYYNGDPIAVLHFPTKCRSNGQDKNYTDITRDYSVADGTDATDGEGKLIYWPKHSEFIRAFEQGHTGYTWYAWNSERLPYTAQIPTQGNGDNILQSEANKMYTKNGYSLESKACRFYIPVTPAEGVEQPKDYRGWHEFALATGVDYDDSKPKHDFGNINDNNWWTLCLPFDMTKENLRQVFGNPAKDADHSKLENYPVVCTLAKVTRDKKKNLTTLIFDENHVKADDADDVVVMKKGVPYMIKPKMPDAEDGATWIPSNHVLHYEDLNWVVPRGGIDEIITSDNAATSISLTAEQIGEEKEDTIYHYRFIGSFSKWYLPQNAYYFGWNSAKNRPCWFYNIVLQNTFRNWNPHTCVILVTSNKVGEADNTAAPPFKNAKQAAEESGTTGAESSHWEIWSGTKYTPFCYNDAYMGSDEKPIAGQAKSHRNNAEYYDVAGLVTGIGQIRMDFTKAEQTSTTAMSVYNLSGQMVSRNGDTSRLPKGIYIRNGRKFVVK